MKHWFELVVHGELASFGGAGIGLALVLIAALLVALPKGERRKLRPSVWLLLVHVAIVTLRTALPLHADAQSPLRVAAAFFLFACLGRSAFLLLVDGLLGRRMGRPLSKIFRDIIQVFVYIAVALLTLRSMGVEPGSLLTTSALLTAVIGLSLQETLGNLFAGLSIQAQRPFEVGDWVQFEADTDCIGRVTEINWRATKVLTDDMVEMAVPNGTLAKAMIRNFSQPTRVSRRTVIVQGPYEVAPQRVEAALFQAIRGAAGVLEAPAPSVFLESFADSGIEYRVHYFIDEFKRRREIDSQVRARIWYAFQRAGISIPFPIRDVRTIDAAAAAEVERTSRLEERLRALRNVDFLGVLPADALDRLAKNSAQRLFAPGEDIIVQGAEGDELFIVLSGQARVLVANDEGEQTEVARLATGDFFGEMSLLTGVVRSATVRAGSRSELLVIGPGPLRPLLEQTPQLAEHISHVIGQRHAQLEERAADSKSVEAVPAEQRERVLLSRIKDLFSL